MYDDSSAVIKLASKQLQVHVLLAVSKTNLPFHFY